MVDCGLKQSAKDAPSTEVVTRQFTSLLLLHYRFHITTDRITSRHELLICLDCGLYGMSWKTSVFLHLPSSSQKTKMDPLHASVTTAYVCMQYGVSWRHQSQGKIPNGIRGWGAIVCNTISPSVSYPAHSVFLCVLYHPSCPFSEIGRRATQRETRRGPC